MQHTDGVSDAGPVAALVPPVGPASMHAGPTESAASLLAGSVTVCVVCCSTASMPHDAVMQVAKAITSDATVRAVLLSETGTESADGLEVFSVPHGTKLSKIRRLAGLIDADLICICDPDLAVDEGACRSLVQQAVAETRAGKDVVVYGVVEGRDDGTLLSRVIALDKWLSHRVLRPCLWAAGIGITLPGQFLVVSAGLLRSLNPGVDSYLDDLYLGWLARRRGVRVRRVDVVVGEEEPRHSWTGLLTQRMRWMRGLACLFRHLSAHPSAVGLLGVHYLAYHALPVLGVAAIILLAVANPLTGLCVFSTLAAVLSVASRRSLVTVIAFLVVFPMLHTLATLLWWVPVNRSVLTRR